MGSPTAEPRAPVRPLVIGVAGGVAAAVVALVLLATGDGGLDGFVRASPSYADASETPIAVVDDDEGFDGQFYFRLAVAPLSNDVRVEGIAFDLPGPRSARVGYPALAGALALGNPSAVPATLLIVNLFAAGAVAAGGAWLALAAGRTPWWGLALLAFPGFVYTLGFDLAELVEAAAVLGAIVAIRADRVAPAAGALVLAVLTRETAMALPLAIVGLAALATVLGSRGRPLWPGRTAAVAGVTSLVVAGLWQLLGWLRWDEVPMLGSADKNIRVPLGGLLSARDAFAPTSVDGLFRIGSLGLVVLVALAAATTVRWRTVEGSAPAAAPRHEVVAFLVAVAVSMLLSEFVWAGATSFMRGLTEVWLLSLVLLISGTARPPELAPVVVLAAAAGTMATTVAEVGKRG